MKYLKATLSSVATLLMLSFVICSYHDAWHAENVWTNSLIEFLINIFRKTNNLLTNIFEIINYYSDAILAIFTVILAYSTHRSWQASIRHSVLTREIFESSNRPWIKAGLNTVTGLIFDQKNNQYLITTNIKIENIGSAPAVVHDINFRMATSDSLGKKESAFKLHANKNMQIELLPGEAYDINIQNGISIKDIQNWRDHIREINLPMEVTDDDINKMKPLIYLVGSINYISAIPINTHKEHKTYIIYRLDVSPPHKAFNDILDVLEDCEITLLNTGLENEFHVPISS